MCFELKHFGNPADRFKILFSVKLFGGWFDVMLVHLKDRRAVADVLKSVRRARAFVKKMKSSKAYSIFPPYTLRWLVARGYEITVLHEDHSSFVCRYRSAVLQPIIDLVE